MAREHLFSWHRIVPLAVVAVLAAVALSATSGPSWYQRLYHPLSHEAAIARHANAADLDPYLVAAVVNVESGFRPDVVSSAGAVGLMQVKPSTAAAVARAAGIGGRMDTRALSDPDTNLRIGTRYLAELVARYDGDTALALAAYNAGLGNADRWAGEWHRTGGDLSDTIDFPETAHYVDEVVSQVSEYRHLYPDAFSVVP